jgi:hypothetical protein
MQSNWFWHFGTGLMISDAGSERDRTQDELDIPVQDEHRSETGINAFLA